MCRNPAVAAERARKRARPAGRDRTRAGQDHRERHQPARAAARRAARPTSAGAPAPSSTSTRWPSTSSSRSPTAASPTSASTRQIDDEALLDGLYVIRTDQPARDAVGPGRGARLQAAQGRRTRVPPAQEPRAGDPPDLPPPRRPRPRPRLPVHARLLRPVRAQPPGSRRCSTPTTPPPRPATPSRPRNRHPTAPPRPAATTAATATNCTPSADLLAELATLTRNRVRIPATGHRYHQLSEPTPLQTRALELLAHHAHVVRTNHAKTAQTADSR